MRLVNSIWQPFADAFVLVGAVSFEALPGSALVQATLILEEVMCGVYPAGVEKRAFLALVPTRGGYGGEWAAVKTGLRRTFFISNRT